MTRGCAKTAAFMLTRQNKVDGLVAGQGVGMSEQMKGREPPVKAVEAQVLRQPVVVIILPRVQALDVFDMGRGEELELLGEALTICSHFGVLFPPSQRFQVAAVDRR